MAADDFFNRWARHNEQARQARAEEAAATPAPPPVPDPYQGRLPTLEDVQQASATQTDFSPFMKQGVDESVKRSALKKLFTDPHFNVMDGLDIYIGDYSQSDPIPPEMMAMLRHAKDLFDPPGLHGRSVMALQEPEPEPPAATDPAPLAAAPVEEAVVVPVDETADEPSDQAGQADLALSPASEQPGEPASRLPRPADAAQGEAMTPTAVAARSAQPLQQQPPQETPPT
ncbi:DUF3306 domain-containing protein [Lacisediminimonas sp.]|uniref:DUF3306 domain-containing protein n=1 Tax=Lacisediminimonas sp. TaxID=3060582 RepID=UPI00272DB798|nr:DUF3306 domain-containing protein [Lacisediminimonas sp.]